MGKTRSKTTQRPKSPHKTFKRSYREDYQRETNVPGMAEHLVKSFRMFFSHWRIFLPFLAIMSGISFLTIGTNIVISETTGVFFGLIFLIIWLTTIYLVRQILLGRDIKLRDGLYKGLTPLLSTLVIFLIAILECLPIIVLIIVYSAAVQTNFLSTPFYALMFLGFAILMIVFSGYLLASSLMALVAVSAPGLYPLKALTLATDLMMGRKIKFMLRLVLLIIVMGIIWAVIIVPLMVLKVPTMILTIMMMIVACFMMIFMTIYLYLYYKWLLKS